MTRTTSFLTSIDASCERWRYLAHGRISWTWKPETPSIRSSRRVDGAWSVIICRMSGRRLAPEHWRRANGMRDTNICTKAMSCGSASWPWVSTDDPGRAFRIPSTALSVASKGMNSTQRHGNREYRPRRSFMRARTTISGRLDAWWHFPTNWFVP